MNLEWQVDYRPYYCKKANCVHLFKSYGLCAIILLAKPLIFGPILLEVIVFHFLLMLTSLVEILSICEHNSYIWNKINAYLVSNFVNLRRKDGFASLFM